MFFQRFVRERSKQEGGAGHRARAAGGRCGRPAEGRQRAAPGDVRRDYVRAMCWRQLSRLYKTLFVAMFYLGIYNLVWNVLGPTTEVTFIPKDLHVGDKYALIFLAAGPEWPVFSDAEGAEVFRSRGCGPCFITNNKGLLPMSEFDAVLVYGKKALLSEDSAAMDPEKRYLLETYKRCMSSKLTRCVREPRVTSFLNYMVLHLCELCDILLKKRYNHKTKQ